MRVPYFTLAATGAAKTPNFVDSFNEEPDYHRKSSSRHCAPNEERDTTKGGAFPEGFIWCAATASFQIEGAWNQGSLILKFYFKI